ncbi:hypothetical protein Htur_1531 [Haloterrigena turkmenica DSM 5511]|uniref:Uncharacterized protein n=1 Tax=Haloterrigena turkmenica (strain ATCC 51198 / DSM 5511 / JCM 9101 / NCIMB 13204 / VKM B-1734 / 4k) TaxID=543526 RepID=D2RQT6_HALTV|nr:hypothetical protein [Haloterrigena turkmenica]ADB60417.1 hypothetical protein Htur_1531 [Haloterrigena turkmenica DSM 5511]
MQTLEVTDEQYAVIQQLREEISEQVVGKYGFVRERDAVQFLIDNLEGNPDLDVDIDTDLDSSATDDVAASVGAAIDGESASDDLEEVTYIEDDSVDADGTAADAEADANVDVVDPDSEPEPESDAEGGDETADSSDEDASSENDDGEPTGADDDGDDDSSDGSADDDDMLDEMMSLLETHDDKWSESNSADYRYEVELPDGTTEQVQTKDDVRALLFKNYR